MLTVYVYPNGEVYEEPPSNMSDDYESRHTCICRVCGHIFEPHYNEPLASCLCGTVEWDN